MNQVRELREDCKRLDEIKARSLEIKEPTGREKVVAICWHLLGVALIVGIIFACLYAPNKIALGGIIIGGYLVAGIFGKYLQEKYYQNEKLGCYAIPCLLPLTGPLMPLAATFFKGVGLNREKASLEKKISEVFEAFLISFKKATAARESFMSSPVKEPGGADTVAAKGYITQLVTFVNKDNNG